MIYAAARGGVAVVAWRGTVKNNITAEAMTVMSRSISPDPKVVYAILHKRLSQEINRPTINVYKDITI